MRVLAECMRTGALTMAFGVKNSILIVDKNLMDKPSRYTTLISAQMYSNYQIFEMIEKYKNKYPCFIGTFILTPCSAYPWLSAFKN